jgi:hypothetical protein
VKYRYRALSAGVGLRYSIYGSIEGLDRFQYDVTDDFHLKDQRFVFSLDAGLRVPYLPIEVWASYEAVNRHGTIKDLARRDIEDRFSICVGYAF